MRKGLWSPDEDERLTRCIAKYMNGSWSDIARKAGLERCGKSCRRRWMNHLRPDLKRGRFTPAEIRLVVELHEALGNRWSEIAAHLVGRTDNDVKNLWNTQIKRQLKLHKPADGGDLDLDKIVLAAARCSSDHQDTAAAPLSSSSSDDASTPLNLPTTTQLVAPPLNRRVFNTCHFSSQMFVPPVLKQPGLGAQPSINLGEHGMRYHSSSDQGISKPPFGIEFSACELPSIPINRSHVPQDLSSSSSLFKVDHENLQGSVGPRTVENDDRVAEATRTIDGSPIDCGSAMVGDAVMVERLRATMQSWACSPDRRINEECKYASASTGTTACSASSATSSTDHDNQYRGSSFSESEPFIATSPEYEDWVLPLLHNNDSTSYFYEADLERSGSERNSDYWWSSLEAPELSAAQFSADCWTLEMFGMEL